MSNCSEPACVTTLDCSTERALDRDLEPDRDREVSLCEVLDRILNKGVVVAGEVVISVAGIDLVYLNLQLLLSSIEAATRAGVPHLSTGESH